MRTRFHRSLTVLSACSLLMFASLAQANIRVPNVFSDNMVLQTGQAAPVWGWADAGEKVTVKFGGQTKRTTATPEGKWQVNLDSLEVSRVGRELSIQGNNTLTFKNVVVGEVWVCSGQSNMEWLVRNSSNPEKERLAANYPLIRHLKIPHIASDRPYKIVPGTWTVCSPKTVSRYTAVGYFFARRLHRDLDVPIGLINTSWGGTRIEPWIPLAGFKQVKDTDFAGEIINRIESVDPKTDLGKVAYSKVIAETEAWPAKAKAALARGDYPPPYPALPTLGNNHQKAAKLYNGMVHPIVPYGIRGAIWYQGESNGTEGVTYYQKMHALVGGWREVWDQGDFSFYHVQLANFEPDNNQPEGGDGYANIRDFQRQSIDFPKTGMAVITDIGETNDIHPKNKQDVGTRLALWALAKDYGRDVVYSGPLFKRHSVEGSTIRLHFDSVGSGLMVGKKNGLKPTVPVADGKLKRFAIAGSDRKWHWADAIIDGKTVIVSSPQVAQPVAVRYAFSANPLGANLYNKEGLPASGFRTDDWPLPKP